MEEKHEIRNFKIIYKSLRTITTPGVLVVNVNHNIFNGQLIRSSSYIHIGHSDINYTKSNAFLPAGAPAGDGSE